MCDFFFPPASSLFSHLIIDYALNGSVKILRELSCGVSMCMLQKYFFSQRFFYREEDDHFVRLVSKMTKMQPNKDMLGRLASCASGRE